MVAPFTVAIGSHKYYHVSAFCQLSNPWERMESMHSSRKGAWLKEGVTMEILGSVIIKPPNSNDIIEMIVDRQGSIYGQ